MFCTFYHTSFDVKFVIGFLPFLLLLAHVILLIFADYAKLNGKRDWLVDEHSIDCNIRDESIRSIRGRRHETLVKFEQEVFVPHSIEEINKRFTIKS